MIATARLTTSLLADRGVGAPVAVSSGSYISAISSLRYVRIEDTVKYLQETRRYLPSRDTHQHDEKVGPQPAEAKLETTTRTQQPD